MVDRSIFLILTLSCYICSNPCYSETDTLLQGQELKDWDYLISSNKVFVLNFFGFVTTISPYLGIFYNPQRSKSYGYGRRAYYNGDGYAYYNRDGYKEDKAVWVANRNSPSKDIYVKLVIDVHGKLSISSGGGTVVDLFSPTPVVTRNASATLLDTGNFVLQELYSDGSVKRVLWQSFDYPTDTLLPGMKLGINLKTGHRWSLTSWRNEILPADGPFTLKADPNGTGQMVILRRGNIHWRSGSWLINAGFENADLQNSGPDVRLYYISNETEQSFTYLTRTYDSSPALTMNLNGQLNASTLKLNVQCRSISWDNDSGCAEYEFPELDCRKDYHFYKGFYDIYGNEYVYDESYNLTSYDCERLCWTNCSCMAYTYATTNRATCKTYGPRTGKARDESYREYYGIVYRGPYPEEKEKKWVRIWSIIAIASLVSFVSCYFLYKKLNINGKAVKYVMLVVFLEVKKILKLLLHRLRHFYNNIRADNKVNAELHYFTFQSISSATNNFSSANKLGEGGFGAVYKGKLVDGQEVAVKRLSRSSEQGVKEFKNETELIAKLQHTNLVRLIGCCIEKKEKILVYEYMPNKSLDSFLFDPRKKGLLDWNTRFVIIDGIAQGLLYLHRFSRLRVIHRDLKASNILLDDYLKPKISDFGMAKLFGINESEANTSQVVGTLGYMPPEYMLEGSVSTKTDVFGFGVLLLEIVSSKMNHGSNQHDPEHPLNLLGHAWELWNEAGRGLELMDPVLEDSCTPKEVMTCINVGLLCVQDHAMDRPTMSEVVSMLTNENMHLPEPKRPAFFIERHEPGLTKDNNLENGSVNGQSISILVAR
ncbi:G-type lectin S-receptor-like serine/threonine-protein kinase At1g67520 [Lactuca sativa]|uniref:Receptor-like serine/threonine-protein kinase n=1 Tax=Lactuca sativa TaxID=4236 RepID=A0A9R1XVP8_LACSA|nr:G-type lectin S-receptor-like serine/threonine-protein kinase At1g67520 [Lactuca sativa]KAJ0227781.1 hypothetical protein LSAT_V11C100008790 [Lactuca sativa]